MMPSRVMARIASGIWNTSPIAISVSTTKL